MKRGITMNQLSEKQFTNIIDRFTSKTIYPKAFLLHPVKSSKHVIASNSHVILFLSNQLVSDSVSPERFLTAEEGEQLLTLESKLMDNYTQSPNNLTLDGELIQSIIKTLVQHKKDLQACKYSFTFLTYDKSVNELSFIIYADTNPFTREQSFFRPASVSEDINDFTILLNTNYLIDSLQTQYETEQYTSLEHSHNYIRLVNDYTTIVIAKLRGNK